jgi:hypothetical protein
MHTFKLVSVAAHSTGKKTKTISSLNNDNKKLIIQKGLMYLLKVGFPIAFVLWFINRAQSKDVFGKILFDEIIYILKTQNLTFSKRIFIYYLLYIKVPARLLLLSMTRKPQAFKPGDEWSSTD